MKKIAPQARRITKNTEEPDIDPFRRLNSVTEQRLVENDILEPLVGTETRTQKQWKEKRRNYQDQDLFDYLVSDSLETHLVFYREFHDYQEDQVFIEDVYNDDLGMDSEENVVDSYIWFRDEIGIPKTIEYL